MMPVLRIPLVGSITNRNINPDGFVSKDQQFINCYPEIVKNPATGKATAYLYRRPGSTKGAALSGVSLADTFGAIVTWTGSQLSTIPPIAASFVNTSSNTVSIWDLVSDTKIGGDVSSTIQCFCLTETDVSGTPHLVGNFKSSTTAIKQWFYAESGTWTQVTSASLANIVGCPAHMDGYTFNMTLDGKIYNTDLNTVSSVTATNFVSAGQYPDRGVTVARLGPHIIAFGEKSIERFYNAGNPTGSPLSRVQDGGIPMGAARRASYGSPITQAGPASVLTAHGTIYWIATNSEGSVIGIYRFNNGAPEKVSNAAIDKMLASGILLGFSGAAILHGMRHIVMRGVDSVWAYSVDQNYWWKWVYGSIGNLILACVPSNTSTSAGNAVTYFQTDANARSNLMSPSAPVYTDDGNNYAMTVQTQNLDLGTHRKKVWQAVSVIGDVQASSSPLGISFSDDDYATFSSSRTVDMSVANNRLTRWGASRRRAWKFTHATSTPLRIEAVEFEYMLGNP